MQAVIARLDNEKATAEAVLNQPQNRVTRDRSRFLNELFARKAFSWTRLFEDLERVMPAHLHVLSINPDLSKDNNIEIKMVVGGDNSDQARDLVRKMEGSRRFKQTQIESEKTSEKTKEAENRARVQFDIGPLYVPSAEATAGGEE